MKFSIRHSDDAFVRNNCSLFGGEPQEAASAADALRGLGVVELRPHQQVDVREWTITEYEDGSAVAQHNEYPSQRIIADPE